MSARRCGDGSATRTSGRIGTAGCASCPASCPTCPWLNPIEPKWVPGKRCVVEPARLLSARELENRVCAAYGWDAGLSDDDMEAIEAQAEEESRRAG